MADMEKLLEGISLDDKKIQVDSKWYGADELKDTVKKMIDSGDYENVGKYTEALKRIEKVIKEFKEISVKVPISLIEAYEKLAKESSKPVDYHLRMALGNYIDGPKAPAKKEEPKKEEPKKEEPKKEDASVQSTSHPSTKGLQEPKEEKKPQIEMEEEEAEKEEENPAEEKQEEPPAPKPEEEPKEDKKPPKVVRVACHNCKRPITITTTKRPITVICEHCGARGQLSS